MRPIHAGARTSCTAVTVLLQPGDNGMLHVVADQIEDIIATRIVQAAPGVPVEDLVARGDVALGFQQLSELIHLPGIDVLGGLPPEIQLDTVFSAAISCSSSEPEAAKAFLRFIVASESGAVKLRHGATPVWHT